MTGFLVHEATGDFNGDGKVDIATLSYTQLDSPLLLTILQGTGDGKFEPQTPIALRKASDFDSYNMAVGRVNGDNFDDLVMLNGTFEMKVFSGSNSGLTVNNSSATALSLSSVFGVSNPGGQVVLGHFQRADRLDVVILPFDNNFVRLMTNQGDGTFTEVALPVSYANDAHVNFNAGNQTFNEGNQVLLEDLNQDGLDDAIFTFGAIGTGASRQSGVLTVKKTNGPEVFTVSAIAPGSQGQDLQGGDLNGDGLLDLAINSFDGTGGIQLFQGQADGSFQVFPASPFINGTPQSAISSAVFGQFVGGPALDLAFNPTDGIPDPVHGDQKFVFGISAGQNGGHFGVPAFTDRHPNGSNESLITKSGRILVADVNGDGTQDLINLYPDFFTGRSSVLLNTGGTHTTFLDFPGLDEGSPITIPVTVEKNDADAAGAPSGSVTFKNGNTILGQATIVDGHATLEDVYLDPGKYTITAVYPGDDDFLSSVGTSPEITVIVNPGRTKTTLAFPNLLEGQASMSANITKYFPATQGDLDGTITFMEGSQIIGQADVVGGMAIAPLDLAAGDHTIFAVYNGNGTFTQSKSKDFAITILPPPKPPLGLFHIDTELGGLKFNRENQHFEYTGTAHIGLEAAPLQHLLTFNGMISVGTDFIEFQGNVTADIGSYSVDLFDGDFKFSLNSAASLPFDVPADSNTLKFGVVGMAFTGIALVNGGIELGAQLQLPVPFGDKVLDVGVGQGIRIDANGPSFHFTGAEIGFPSIGVTQGGLGLTVSDVTVEYDAPQDQLRVHGKVTIPELFGVATGTQIDLTGDKYIQLKDGNVGLVGDLTIKRVDIVPNVWTLKDVKLHLDTVSNSFSALGTLVFPGGFGVTAGLGIVGGHIDSATLGVSGLGPNGTGVPVPFLPGVFLQSFSGTVSGLSTGHPDLKDATAKFTYLPEVNFTLPSFLGGEHFEVSLVELDLKVDIDQQHLSATGTVDFLKGVKDSGQAPGTQASVNFDWLKKQISINTQLHLIDNIFNLGAKFTADAKGNVTFGASATVNSPAIDFPVEAFGANLFKFHIDAQQLGSGRVDFQYINNSTLTDDFIGFYGTVLGFIHIGGKIDFAGHLSGGKKDPVGQTFSIPANSSVFLLNAQWQNDVGNVPVEVIDPTGRVYTEADFDNTSIGVIDELSDATSKTVALQNPIAGDWTLRIPNETGLVDLSLHGFYDIAPATVAITSLTQGPNGVTVGYDGTSTETDAKVTLYYDTDNTGTDGSVIATNLNGPGAGQSYVWDTTGVAAGTYFVYAKIDDGFNPPEFIYSPNSINIANQAPVLSQIVDQSVNEGNTLTLTAAGVDPNGDTVTYSLAEGTPDGFDIDPATGEITWTPTSAQGGTTYAITVLGTDTGTPALSGSQTFNVSVNEVNTAPVLHTIFDRGTSSGGTISFTVTAEDPDQPVQTLQYSLDSGAPNGASIDPVTGAFTWTPSVASQPGVYPVTIRVTDNGNGPLSSSATVNLTITGAPAVAVIPGSLEFDATTYSIDEGGNATIKVNRTGGSNGVVAVRYAATSGTATVGQDFTSTTGLLIFAEGETSKTFVVPTLHDSQVEGAENLNLSLSAPFGGATLGELQDATVTINNVVAIGPVFTSATTFNVAENQTAVGTVTATDPNVPPQSPTFSITGGADAAKFAITTSGVLTFKSAPDYDIPADTGTNNVYDVEVTADNGTGGTTVQNISVTVTPVNDNLPAFTSSATFNVAENQTAVGTVTATDADVPVQTVTFTITGGADAAKFNISSDGVLTFKSTPDYEIPTDAGGNNSYDLQVTADDGAGGAKTQNISVSVTPINDNSPVLTSSAAFSVVENNKAVGTVTATDADLPSQTLTFSITGGADASQFDISSAGVLTFKSAPSFANPTDAGANNVYNLIVTASDGNGGTTSQSISVTVTEANRGPVISLSSNAGSYLLTKKHLPSAVDATATLTPGTTSPSLAGAKLIISLGASRNSNDVLGLLPGTTNGLTLKGKNLVVGKAVIGKVSGGKGKVPDLTVTFTSLATIELVQQTIQKSSFSTKAAGVGPRTVQMRLTFVGGPNTNTAARQIVVHS